MKRILQAAVLATVAMLPLTAQAAKDSVTMGMTLEPPGLDPSTGAAAAIAQITLYNVFEGLTRVNEDSTVSPMLAESWTVSDDQKTYTFKLLSGVKWHDGTDFDAGDVKFTFERNAAEDSQNKRKKYFTNMASVEALDPHTLRITLKEPRPTFLFNMGESTAVIVNPEAAASNATKPIGTGPFRFVKWVKGDSVSLEKNPDFRDAASVMINKVKFRFINDQAARIAAVLVGDVDLIGVSNADATLGPLKNHPRIEVVFGTTEGETILSTNNKNPALSKLKVRQAIAHALNREEIIDGAMFGAGVPIGTHFAPQNPDYVDLTGTYPFDLEKSKALLAEAGYAPGSLELRLALPPIPYARDGGQIVAQQLEKAGFKIKIENVEWAVWLDQVYKQKNYDLSIVSHVEPMDIGIYANPDYYFQYDSKDFQETMKMADGATDPAERSKYLKMAQRMIAEDAVNGYLFQLARIIIKDRGLKGIWKNSPFFVNDMRAVHWDN